MKFIDIVTGVGYGDEGKGVTTKALCLGYKNLGINPLVVRYGGGNQVGHTVGFNGGVFEHHHTGSGTTIDVPTYYSEYCTVDPIGTIDEIETLIGHGLHPLNIYDPKCMIVTPMDVAINRHWEAVNAHGSVGVGFGATIERNENNYHLFMQDIKNESIFKEKYNAIKHYYFIDLVERSPEKCFFERFYQKFMDADEFYNVCKQLLSLRSIRNKGTEREVLTECCEIRIPSLHNVNAIVFEGHQGTLLDMEYGIFPNVTRSKTTCKNAFSIIEKLFKPSQLEEIIDNKIINLHMISRSYHTRHGNGFFEEGHVSLVNNEHETNHLNKYQGEFKTAPLDLDLLETGISYNLMDIPYIFRKATNDMLVITCCDQLEDIEDVLELIKIKFWYRLDEILTTWSPDGKLSKINNL